MKKLLISIIVCGQLLGCVEDEDALPKVYKEVDTYLVNELAVDGCSWHFRDALGIRLAPNDAAQARIDAFVASVQSQNGMLSVPVVLEYAPEDRTKKITCGWGQSVEMDAIDIRSLRIREEDV